MMKAFRALILAVLVALGIASCGKDDAYDATKVNTQTILVYMPWSGNLYDIFQQNLDSIEGAIIKANGMSGRVVVYINTSATEAQLYEISYKNREIVHTPLKSYSGTGYTTADGIAEILNDVKSNAEALNYSMMVGCHGYGWTYKDDWYGEPRYAKSQVVLPSEWSNAKALDKQNGAAPYPTTRYFGSYSPDYGTDVKTLAEGIAGAGMKMQFILFDDCYMGNIETAYELRNATNYLLASTSEVMAIGVPYQSIWSSLASATPKYSVAIGDFGIYYHTYHYPYGTLSAIDCRKVETLAATMKEINARYSFDSSLLDSLQVLDGFETPIFYDMGDYVNRLCTNTSLLSDFQQQLDDVVKAEVHTDSIYSYLLTPKFIPINTFSGITISDPSRNNVAIKGRQKTAWWNATHNQ